MDIILRNETDDPIYQQIIDQVKAQIIEGKLTVGDALPSMRALAAQLRGAYHPSPLHQDLFEPRSRFRQLLPLRHQPLLQPPFLLFSTFFAM